MARASGFLYGSFCLQINISAIEVVGTCQVRQLQPTAVAAWWQAGHPGWAIYPVDSETFMSAGTLDTLQVQHEQVVVPQLAAPGESVPRC